MTIALFFMLTCGAVNLGYAYALAFLLIVLLQQRLRGRKIYFNFLYSPGFWLLLCAGISYVTIGMQNLSALYHYGILPLLAYMMGWCASEKRKDEAIRNFVLALVAGFGVYAILNDLINIGSNRYMLIDFWTGAYRSATGSGILNTMTVSIVMYVFILEKRKWVRFFFSLLFLFTIHYMFVLGTRTQFIILVVVNLMGGLLLSYRKRGLVGMLKLAGIIAVIALCIFIIYQSNIFSVQDRIYNTNLAYRFTDKSSLERSDEFRIQSFWTGLKELFIYPLGGRIQQTYRHNMWLDVGRISGMIPFTLLAAYSVVCLSKVWRIYRSKVVSAELRYLLMFLYTGVYINFFVEPIWEGQLNLFLAMCVVDGMVSARRITNESDSGKSISDISKVRTNM